MKVKNNFKATGVTIHTTCGIIPHSKPASAKLQEAGDTFQVNINYFKYPRFFYTNIFIPGNNLL